MGTNSRKMTRAVQSIIKNDRTEASNAVKDLIQSHIHNLMEFNRGAVKFIGDDVVVNGKRVGSFENDRGDYKKGIVLKLDGEDDKDFDTMPELVKHVLDAFRITEFNEGPIEVNGDYVLVNGKKVGKIETDLNDLAGRMVLHLKGGRRFEFDTIPELYKFVMGEFNIQEGYTIMPGIDRDRYQKRDGLEGPFMAKNGKVVYYDPIEGKYYDPDSDIYIGFGEWEQMDRSSEGVS